jgi:hypothetical protein
VGAFRFLAHRFLACPYFHYKERLGEVCQVLKKFISLVCLGLGGFWEEMGIDSAALRSA